MFSSRTIATAHTPNSKFTLDIFGTLAFSPSRAIVPKCRKCHGCIPKFEMMKSMLFLGVPLYPLQWSAALRPTSGEQFHPCCRARKLQPCGKFLSILGNFCSAFIGCTSAIGINSIALGLLNKSSRISFRYAKNIPNMPKGDIPLETPRQRVQSRACSGYAECTRGKTVGQTPQRLNRKQYTPIAPQQKLVRL